MSGKRAKGESVPKLFVGDQGESTFASHPF